MKTVAYCRVSTNKDEQLDSLEAQQVFFGDYSKKNDYDLLRIYADEGKSGTKMKNRTELLRLLSDAQRGLFEVVLIKDVSRLARNTLDFLDIIRKLKALNIKVIFVNYDQTSSDSSEFMLTLMSAMAQEESANTSKRIKFGKKINKEKGRVPNLVFGYDKIEGEYFTLSINENESKVVKEIFEMYVNENLGMSKIATELNRRNIKTKRNSNFTQNSISRILKNPIYIGKIINGKEETKDFLTGEREAKPEEDWYVNYNEDLRILDDGVFNKAQELTAKRCNSFKVTSERTSQKHAFSKLIKCECCGFSFRQFVRKNANDIRFEWVCRGRNANGTDWCNNKTKINEDELIEAIRDYFTSLVANREQLIITLTNRFEKIYRNKDENINMEKELTKKLDKLNKSKKKYMDMYDNDIIDMKELKSYTEQINADIAKVQKEIEHAKANISKSDLFKNEIITTLDDIEEITKENNFNNAILSRLIEKISVDEKENINIHLRLTGDIYLNDDVPLSDNYT